ncbi:MULTISPECIES: hypothetical protein [Bradyrhizobium]|uniref:Uncharacterized protein n=1 Tax=Bradyrhizobium yuanmingense TaxID=108015 RepID=A0A1C3XLV8_9BRAD|nr:MULTISPECIES: hypothetical protein [Bradyrhizobium]MCA1545145.1 hypothetical protein [Bradyrhizobium sp. NBAIM32]TWI16442.1 hypothetical protein IQ15_07689 [Bradyrhizobium yuanmingense]UWU93614.1 hypothetical protein N2604_06805 [Bradyrhizobium sp. CB1015]SCB53209.1 hypothetical protein GA0061099_10527 [Bradyrhizobium yuanmingense]
MEIEDGLIWVYGVGEDGVQAVGNGNDPTSLRPTPDAYAREFERFVSPHWLLPADRPVLPVYIIGLVQND